MPRNTKGGKKSRRGANRPARVQKLKYAGDDEDYAKVLKALGDRRFSVICMSHPDRQDVVGHVRGKMRKKVWVKVGDWVLISYRDTVEKCKTVDIIHKYDKYQVSQLKSDKLIQDNVDKKEDDGFVMDDDLADDSGSKTYQNDPYGAPDRSGPRTAMAFEDAGFTGDNDESDNESDDESSKPAKADHSKPQKEEVPDISEFEDIGDFNIDDI